MGNKTHLFDRKMAEHELSGQIKSASSAQQHIVTSENNLKRAADPKIELRLICFPPLLSLLPPAAFFNPCTHSGISCKDRMSLRRSLNSVPKLQSGYINVAGSIVIKVVGSQWVTFQVWVRCPFQGDKKTL